MDEKDTGYFQELIDRVGLAVTVPFSKVRHCDWEPAKSDCHGNVAYWVDRHPQTEPVRGWLFWSVPVAGQYTFIAHSVIKENGELVDITPIDDNTPREGWVFLQHAGVEEQFMAMRNRCSRVVFPHFSVGEWREIQLGANALAGEEDSEF
jgi:hypothetical protein